MICDTCYGSGEVTIEGKTFSCPVCCKRKASFGSSMPNPRPCRACGGSGSVSNTPFGKVTCGVCGGKGSTVF